MVDAGFAESVTVPLAEAVEVAVGASIGLGRADVCVANIGDSVSPRPAIVISFHSFVIQIPLGRNGRPSLGTQLRCQKFNP